MFLVHFQLPVVPGGEDQVAPDIVVPQPMKENTKLTISDFELLKTIGQGSVGKVFQVRCFRLFSVSRFA